MMGRTATIGAVGILAFFSVPAAPGGTDGSGAAPAPGPRVVEFLREQEGTAVSQRAGRVRRVYGRAVSGGATALESAEAFRLANAGLFEVDPRQLVAAAPGPGAAAVQPIMYDPATGSYRFTAHSYRQELDGVPVFGAQLRLLVRNEPGYPLVLASADLRDLGGFRVDPAAAAAPASADSLRAALDRAAALSIARAEPGVASTMRVIFAGAGDQAAAPRLADATEVTVGFDRWLIVTDASNAQVLHEEHLICIVDIAGTVSGLATEGVGADQCEREIQGPMPYLLVLAGVNSDFADADGNFLIPNPGSSPITVSATPAGQWFEVFDFSGPLESVSVVVTPPGPAGLVFNSSNTDPEFRAQVNGYVHANRIRDAAIQANPAYPTLNDSGFPVNVNRTDFVCPGNAWYDPGGPSINFCLPGGGAVNTAFASVVYHEYGHHLVQAGGSGQGQYGEGMGDVMSVVLLDDPVIGLGFGGNCASGIRTADNSLQYPCSGEIHFCGQLIAGCVWDTRNGLVVTEPAAYTDILADLAINSILMHTGSSITPDIAIDWLTLDDDDADLGNGTPHFVEIANGFAAHNMFEYAVTFTFPSGLPALIAPSGGTTVPVEVEALTAIPEPGSGRLHVDTGGGFSVLFMNELAPNVYEAVFPAVPCGAQVSFYFSVQTTLGLTLTDPPGAPASVYTALAAANLVPSFADDFQTDQGWTVDSSSADGPWERGVPIPTSICDRGNPGSDGDGSGQCYLTDNSSANNCNSDVDDGSTTLTSPVMDASGDSYLTYRRWYSNTVGNSPFQDVFVVEVSGNGGASWVNLETVGPDGPEVDGGWITRTFRVADYVTPSSQFRVRFIASDTDPQSVVEAAVDGVRLESIECDEPCLADCGDGDGIVGIVDLLALLAGWGGTGPCDLDGGGIGINDLLALLAEWGACPSG